MKGVKGSQPPCKVKGCPRPSHARGCCHKHYATLRRRGDPHYTPPTFEQRLWSYVDRTGGKRACWTWHGPVSGPWKVPKIGNESARRVLFRLVMGREPRQLTHAGATQPSCVNPHHMVERGGRDTCDHGHPWTAENTWWIQRASGTDRQCKECHRVAARESARRQRAKAKAER